MIINLSNRMKLQRLPTTANSQLAQLVQLVQLVQLIFALCAVLLHSAALCHCSPLRSTQAVRRHTKSFLLSWSQNMSGADRTQTWLQHGRDTAGAIG